MNIQTFVLLISLLLLSSCSDKKTKNKSVVYSVVSSTGKITLDTAYSSKRNQADTLDKLLAKDIFTYFNKDHVIKVYTSDNHAPIDGGQLYYTLDSIGIIYIRSTTWPGFSRLKSDNDSINDLIDQALAYIIEKTQFHCYLCNLVDTTTMTFSPPIIKDE